MRIAEAQRRRWRAYAAEIGGESGRSRSLVRPNSPILSLVNVPNLLTGSWRFPAEDHRQRRPAACVA